MKKHRVVIVGGGFGGLAAAQAFARTTSKAWDFELTLIDKRNFHLFQPLLYQVATGSLASGNIASPLRRILGKYPNVTVLQEHAVDLAPSEGLIIGEKTKLSYDTLIVATGSHHSYFGHDEWGVFAPGLKTVEDAQHIRAKVLSAFEKAELEPDPHLRTKYLTFVIIGGGPTGVEMAGALAELARGTLKGEFRSIQPGSARIILIENSDRILQTYNPKSSDRALRALKHLGVEVMLGTMAVNITGESVTVERKGEKPFEIATNTVLWAAGMRASALARVLHERTGAALHRSGRVIVRPDCSIEGHPNIFVIGDLAYFETSKGALPGLAPVAIQQGRSIPKVVEARLSGSPAPKPFHYRDMGSLAVIGRNQAVMELGKIRLGGFVAWFIWALVHIANLIEFENKLSVIIQWGWAYFTNGRGSRLIVEQACSSKPN